MLSDLFGNKSVERILLFLLVNGQSYPSQIHRMLQTSLTPLQKAFGRLERSSLLLSQSKGKTRIYRFNPSYPLLAELEHLLRKAYSELPPGEKKQYTYLSGFQDGRVKESRDLLTQVFQQLQKVNRVRFSVRSGINEMQGEGEGSVVVSVEAENRLLFHEEGRWHNNQSGEFQYSNLFRWTARPADRTIALEHLRLGEENPVFLFDLVPSGPHLLESLHPHLCETETYFGQLLHDKQGLHLSWRILGPQKNEEIIYHYQS